MSRFHLLLFVLLVIFVVDASALPQPSITVNYLSYNPQTGLNDLSQTIIYQFPDPRQFGNGPFPLFVWVPATLESNRSIQSSSFVNQMAARGFVAAAVQYSNTNPVQNCSDYRARAQGIFESLRATSAVGVLCSLTGVSCSKGIAVAGLSQGAAISVLSKNYAPNVQAVYAMSISDFNLSGFGTDLPCLDAQNTAIAKNRLMIVNGQNDPFFGGQSSLQNVSGFTCPQGSTQCWSPDGSGGGWYRVQNSQVSDGNADHCYQMNGDCSLGAFDMNWYLSNLNWAFRPNLDWLATFGTRRTFSPAGQ